MANPPHANTADSPGVSGDSGRSLFGLVPEGVTVRQWLVVAASVIPGVGHILAGATWRGVVLFFLFAMAANGVLIGAFLWEGKLPAERILWGSALAVVGLWVWAAMDCYKIVVLRNSPERLVWRDGRFREGVLLYLRENESAARDLFLEVLEVFPEDVDALFYLGCSEMALGRRARAIKAFKRLRVADELGKWSWETDRQLERLTEKG